MKRITFMLAILSASLFPQVKAEELIRVAVDGRLANATLWRNVLLRCETPAQLGAALRGMARVGGAELVPVVKEVLERDDGWTPDVQRSAALAVALLGEPKLLGRLATRVAPADLARALGGVGRLPEGTDRGNVLASVRKADEGSGSSDRVTDATVARLVYGIRVKEPVFRADAIDILGAEKAKPEHVRAAAYWAARHPERPNAELAKALGRHLMSADEATAAYATRAFARAEGAGEPEATVLAAALGIDTKRSVRLARLRALAALPPAPALSVVTRMLRNPDPHLRRTALDTAARWGQKVAPDDRAALAAFAIVMEERDPVLDVRRAAVHALARLAPQTFVQRLVRYRLAAPWQLRAAAAGALQHVSWMHPSYMSPQSPDRPAGDAVSRAAYAFREDPDTRVRIALLEACVEKLSEKGKPAQALLAVDMINPGNVISARKDTNGERVDYLDFMPSPKEDDTVILAVMAKIGKAALGYERNAQGDIVIGGRRLELIGLMGRGYPLPHHETEAFLEMISLARAVAAVTRSGENAYNVAVNMLKHAANSKEPALRAASREGLEALDEEVPNGPSRDRPEPLPSQPDRAVIETTRGKITLRLHGDVAPGTVANFVALARSGHYEGILFHRVVPGFVAQAGCPRGDGWGGPGHTVRCEVNDLTYRRGTVGMALAGKDTGGSQWFICHAPQPHLDLRYTVFGQVESGWDALDALVQGDAILRIQIPK